MNTTYTSDIVDILDKASKRIVGVDLTYSGLLFPQEAYQLLRQLGHARLVDVRTRAELDWVGRVPGAIEIEFKHYPGMQNNPNFMIELEARVNKSDLLLFICRSGQRSSKAAEMATMSGYERCYNVLEGFEGDRDTNNQRGHRGGWRMAGLPWEQS